MQDDEQIVGHATPRPGFTPQGIWATFWQNMPFAKNCPPDDCPPDDVQGVEGLIVRFVRNDPPEPTDLETYADQGKHGDTPCTTCAVSVFRRIEDVHVARSSMSWFRKRKVATAELNHEHGVIRQTGPNERHYSLWVERSHIPSFHTLFHVVEA